MLSKTADHIYWMSRYIERASNIARFLEVNHGLMLDLPDDAGDQWAPLISVTGDLEAYEEAHDEFSAVSVLAFLAFDPEYPNSILSCLEKARESARIVRGSLSPELWEEINSFYHYVTGVAEEGVEIDDLFDFCYDVKTRGMLIGGVAADSITHGEAWSFFQLGRYLERADKTSRILDVKYFILLPSLDYIGSPYDDIQWSALLRSTSALETYRNTFGSITPSNVVRLLLLDRAFPRSVRFCLTEAERCLRAVAGSETMDYSNPPERRLGRLLSDLRFASVEDIIGQGLHEYIDHLQMRINELDLAIYEEFFSVPPLPAAADQAQS